MPGVEGAAGVSFRSFSAGRLLLLSIWGFNGPKTCYTFPSGNNKKSKWWWCSTTGPGCSRHPHSIKICSSQENHQMGEIEMPEWAETALKRNQSWVKSHPWIVVHAYLKTFNFGRVWRKSLGSSPQRHHWPRGIFSYHWFRWPPCLRWPPLSAAAFPILVYFASPGVFRK